MNHDEAWEAIRTIHPWLPSSRKGWHQHPNGGGWVNDTALVADSAIVQATAVVGAECRLGAWCSLGKSPSSTLRRG